MHIVNHYMGMPIFFSATQGFSLTNNNEVITKPQSKTTSFPTNTYWYGKKGEIPEGFLKSFPDQLLA